MKSRWSTATRLTTAGLVLGVVLLLAVNIFSNAAFTSMRLDLTANKLYTLTDGTASILAGLDEPVQLRLYLSKGLLSQLPGTSSYARRVEELLREYERFADGKLSVTVIDPEPFSEEEDRAVGYGLHGVPLDEESAFYFGLVASGSTDEEEVIPFLSTRRQEFLEYDVTRLIYKTSNPKQKVVGLISSLPIDGAPPQAALAGGPRRAWMVLDHVRQFFEIRRLDKTIKVVPDDIDMLMIVHPRDLGDSALYAIDQFVLSGGRVLTFVDPHSEIDQASSTGLMGLGASGGSDFSKLLDAWGIELVPKKVVGDLQLATRVRFQREGRVVTMDYPVWITLPPSLFNQQDTVTAELGNLAFATPGHLIKKSGADTELTPLVESTEGAAEIDTIQLASFQDPQDILRKYKPAGKRFVIAARVTGSVGSAFADGPPPVQDEKKDKPDKTEKTDQKPHEHLAKSKGNINLIVVADSDMLRDHFWIQVQDFLGSRLEIPTAANGTFVINALDSLTGSNDLIGIRSRGRFTRPFTRVNALRQQAELQYRQKEQELIERLEQTETRLTELQKAGQDQDAPILTEGQQHELTRFRQEKIRIRKDLRDVRHELRRNIEGLETRMKFVNIGMMPLLIGIGGILVGSYRIRLRKKGVRTTAKTG
ncbi:MAG: Gldg family protein [Acidiferrobacterales bacterium]